MLRKVAQTLLVQQHQASTVRLFQVPRYFQSSKNAAGCYMTDSDMKAANNILERQRSEEKEQVMQQNKEKLLCQLGSLFYRHEKRINRSLEKHLTPPERATIAALKADHQEHRLLEHNELIGQISKELELAKQRLATLEQKKANVKSAILDQLRGLPTEVIDVNALISKRTNIIDEELRSLRKKVDELNQSLIDLQKMDTSSSQFLVEKEYQDVAYKKLKR